MFAYFPSFRRDNNNFRKQNQNALNIKEKKSLRTRCTCKKKYCILKIYLRFAKSCDRSKCLKSINQGFYYLHLFLVFFQISNIASFFRYLYGI